MLIPIIVLALTAPDPMAEQAKLLDGCTSEKHDAVVTWTCGDVHGTVRDLRTKEDADEAKAERDAFVAGAGRDELGEALVGAGPLRLDRVWILHPDGRLSVRVATLIGTLPGRIATCEASGVEKPVPKDQRCQLLAMEVSKTGLGLLGPPVPRLILPSRKFLASAPPPPAAKPLGALSSDVPTSNLFASEPPAKVAGPTLALSLTAPDEAEKALRAAFANWGKPVVDAGDAENELQGVAMLRTGNLDGARFPAFLPKEFATDWDDAVTACKLRAGGPPYGLKNKQAFLCGFQATDALWQRWLAHYEAAEFVSVELRRKDDASHELVVRAYRPDDTNKRELTSEARGMPETFAAVAVALAKRALDGEGRKMPRNPSAELPKPPPGAKPPSDAMSIDPGPLALDAACLDKLPALEIGPDTEAFTRTLASQWTATLGERHPAQTWNCSLTLQDVTLDAALGGMMQVKAELSCPQGKFSAANLGLARYHPSMQKGLSNALLGSVAKKACQ